MDNYKPIVSRVWWRRMFAYIDTPDYLADEIFVNNHIRVNFKKEFSKEDCKYILIFATCSVKDWDKIESVMKQLSDKMLILGNSDYVEYCTGLMAELEKTREESKYA